MEILTLSGTRVTDGGLRTIAALRSVRALSLESDDITDAGLGHLEALKPLEVLLLASRPKVTDAGVARLKKALPRCDIHR